MAKVFVASETYLYDYAGIEWATGLISNQDGSIYYAGFSKGHDDFGGANFQADLALISANGAIEWSKTITDGSTYAYGITAAPDGGVYVFGHQNQGGFDCYARRYDRLGRLQWSRLIGTSQVDQGMAAASDATGRLYAVGYTQGNYAGINAGSNDIALTSINSDGTIAWRTQAGGNGSDIAMAIATGPNGLIYVAGFTDGSFGSQQNAGLDDGFLACFNSAGELLWNRLIGGSGTDHAYGLRVFTDGSIYVTGRQQRNQNPTAGTDEGDVFVSRFNALGDLLWTRYLGSSGYEYGRSIAESADGLALITGRTDGALEGRPSYGGFDAFVAAFDSSGTRLHLDTIGTSYDDAGNIITAGQDGSLYLSGMAGGRLNGKNHSQIGTYDAFVAKISLAEADTTIDLIMSNIDEGPRSVAPGESTSDTTPTFNGTLSAPLAAGDILKLYNGTSFLIDAVVDPATLTWSATPSLTTNGTYTITARVVDAAGNQGPASAKRTFILDTLAPLQAATITAISDNTGTIQGPITQGGITNDTTPTLSGTLSAPLAVAEILTIYRNGIAAGNATVNNTSLTWTFTTAPLNNNGSHSFTAAVVDGAGNKGPLSSPYTIQLEGGGFDGNPWSYDWSSASTLAGTPGLLKASVQVNSPRSGEPALSVTALRVDLQTPGLRLTSTGPIANWQADSRETLTQTTRDFITGNRLQATPVVAAINTSFFTMVDPSQSLPTNLLGLAISDNRLVSPTQAAYPYFALDSITGARLEKNPSIAPDLNNTNVAFAGMSNGIVLWDGMLTWSAEQNTELNARTALGLSSDNRYLVLMTVDRSLRSLSPSYWGATLNDVGALLYGFGAYRGLNLDGGGSTQMAWWNSGSASAELLNDPLFGIERPVGSSLGIVYQPPG